MFGQATKLIKNGMTKLKLEIIAINSHNIKAMGHKTNQKEI